MLLPQDKPTDPCSEFLMSRDAKNLLQNDENTLRPYLFDFMLRGRSKPEDRVGR